MSKKILSSWGEKRIEDFKKFYKENGVTKTSEFFGISMNQCVELARMLGVKSRRSLTKFEQEYILLHVYADSNNTIANFLGVSVHTVNNFCRKNNIHKDPSWSDCEIGLLKETYPKYTNNHLAKNVFRNRNSHSIRRKANKLGITKNYIVPKKYNLELSKKQLLDTCEKLGRIPFERELIEFDLPSARTLKRYGFDYKTYCKSFGFFEETLLFGKPVISQSVGGITCFSNGEKTITNLLEKNNIPFVKEVRYDALIQDENCKNKKFDWVLYGCVPVEFFGMYDKPSYKLRADEKIELCKKHNINLIALYPKDINKENILKTFAQIRNDYTPK